MNPTLGLGLLLVGLLTVHGLLQPNRPPQSHEDASQAQAGRGRRVAQELARWNTDFGLKLFKKLASHNNGRNIFFSPLSIAMVFSMLCLGAQDSTLAEIRQVFNFRELPEQDVHEGFHYLIQKLNQSSQDLKLRLGNALFIDQRLEPQQKFLKGLKDIYFSDTIPINFQNQQNAEKQINDYVSQKTHGKITNLVRSVNPNTLLLLVNYVYFLGRWLHEFDPKLTKEEDFMANGNKLVKVPMMFRGGMYKMGHDDRLSCTVLEMPYKRNLTAILVLPDKGKLRQVEEAIQVDTMARWKKLTTQRVVDVSLPKFFITGIYDLKKTMAQLGISKVFEEHGDLTKISLYRNLKVGEAVHKAELKVDERGSEAAASSAMETLPMETPIDIRFNRTFLMLIVEDITTTVLFLGKIGNPSGK
ncbi:serpin A12 [Dasypus novemcinctus]|uniref:serpin A12 n=1 Tax=Dasypus novemcinctus TaxID=9361 RepID=UPI00265FA916|nr:serpin A12 [Dasypus novemcinctus]